MPEQEDRRKQAALEDPLTLDPAARTRKATAPRARATTPVVPPPRDDAFARMRRAWARHPVVAFVTHGRRIAFYRQMHSLIKSGSGMPVAMAEMAKYAPDAATRNALAMVSADIQKGATLGEAMARHTGLFEDATLELLAFAEETGNLERILSLILDSMQKQQRLRWTAIMASLWPAYLLGGFVLFGPLFDVGAAAAASHGGHVAWGSVYVVALLRNVLYAALALGTLVGGPLLLAAANVEASWDRLKLALPGVGAVIRAGYASRFFLALGLALSAGVEAVRALRISLRASGSTAIAARSAIAESRLRSGGTLADAVEAIGVFPRSAIGTLAIAEKTGTIDQSLEQLSIDNADVAVRGMKILVIVTLGIVGVVALLLILRPILGTLFGPITDYFHQIDGIE